VLERADASALIREPACAHRVRSSEPFRAITLSVHSSLEAVGLIVAVSRALADAGIPANVIAGYHHDHVLVPTDRAAEALRALGALSRSA
jgi:hypothetical protein